MTNSDTTNCRIPRPTPPHVHLNGDLPPEVPTDKHQLLYKAIQGIDASSNKLERLIDRARASKSQKTVVVVAPSPSLMGLLNHGPEIVHKKLEALNAKIDELNALLFQP